MGDARAKKEKREKDSIEIPDASTDFLFIDNFVSLQALDLNVDVAHLFALTCIAIVYRYECLKYTMCHFMSMALLSHPRSLKRQNPLDGLYLTPSGLLHLFSKGFSIAFNIRADGAFLYINPLFYLMLSSLHLIRVEHRHDIQKGYTMVDPFIGRWSNSAILTHSFWYTCTEL